MKFPIAHVKIKGTTGFTAHRDKKVTWKTGGKDGRAYDTITHVSVGNAKRWMHEQQTASA